MLHRIEGNNAHRIIELTRHQIAGDGFEVGPLNYGLAVDGAIRAEAVYDKVDGLIGPIRHNGRRRARCRRLRTSNATTSKKRNAFTSVDLVSVI